MVERFLVGLATRYKTVHRICNDVIKQVFKRAVRVGNLAISPANRKGWDAPPLPAAETSIPTLEEGRALWHAIQERAPGERVHTHINQVAAIALAMWGGMERGVLAALMWEDVDWVRGVIKICRSWGPWRDGIKATKTKFRIRQIRIGPEIRSSLTTLWERDGKPSVGYVFHTTGKRRSRTSVYNAVYQEYLVYAMRKAGFVDEQGSARWSFHELRHYAGSVWLEAGATMHEVSRMLGHSNTQTTQKHYIHYFEAQEAERHRLIAGKVSAMHRLPGNTVALPAPMREICEIDGEATDITDNW
jgi:integrase